jgi:hypothetical protein
MRTPVLRPEHLWNMQHMAHPKPLTSTFWTQDPPGRAQHSGEKTEGWED